MCRGVEGNFHALRIICKGCSDMCDVLKKAALAYERLAQYEYQITCGRKGHLLTVVLSFPESAFHHLAGFQYARLEKLKEQKSALQVILSEQVSAQSLSESGFKHWDRLEGIIALQENLEQNRFVFRYREHECPFSKIQADYLLTWEDVVFFIANQSPVSIFRNVLNTEYEKRCPKFTVLKIERISKSTQEVLALYQR